MDAAVKFSYDNSEQEFLGAGFYGDYEDCIGTDFYDKLHPIFDEISKKVTKRELKKIFIK